MKTSTKKLVTFGQPSNADRLRILLGRFRKTELQELLEIAGIRPHHTKVLMVAQLATLWT